MKEKTSLHNRDRQFLIKLKKGNHRKESVLSINRFPDGRLVDSFADNEHAAKWQFATQLWAVYGLRPEELRYLVLKNNKTELWTTYKKSNSKINVRRLFPLFV